MHSVVNSVSEGDVVREFVQFAIDRERITARVRDEGKPARCGDDGILNHEVAIKEELQDRDACTCDGAVTGGISRMGRRTFRIRHREEVISELIETGLNGL